MANIDNDPSFSVAVGIEYDGKCFSLEVQGAEQHAIAHGQFTALPVDRTTTELGSWTYRDAQCTMHVEEDRFVEAKYPDDADLPSTLDAIRRKVFYAGAAYQLIDVLQATPVDVDDDGELKTVTTAGGAYLRDDREKLKSLALLAASWWLVPRKVARIVSARPSATPLVGQLLTAINPGTSHADVINTVISEIRLATPLAENSPALPAMYSITTAMGELDPLAFSPAPPQQILAGTA
jgi:hypothetical protein